MAGSEGVPGWMGMIAANILILKSYQRVRFCYIESAFDKRWRRLVMLIMSRPALC